MKHPRQIRTTFSNFPKIQKEFFFYKCTKAKRAQLVQDEEIFKLLDNSAREIKYTQIEHALIYELIEFLILYQEGSVESSKRLYQSSGKITENMSKVSKLLGDINLFQKQNQGLKELVSTFFAQILKRSSFMKYERISEITSKISLGDITESNIGILVLSGKHETIGRIAYVNRAACEMLTADSNDLLGTHFSRLIPPPFDAIHNDVLRNFLIVRMTSMIHRPSIFCTCSDGYAIEAEMTVRILCYQNHPYFIVNLNKAIEDYPFVLLTKDYVISAFSRQMMTITKDIKSLYYIDTVFPKITEYMVSGNDFSYVEDGLFLYCRLEKLIIDKNCVYVLFISKPGTILRVTTESRIGTMLSQLNLQAPEYESENDKSVAKRNTYSSTIIPARGNINQVLKHKLEKGKKNLQIAQRVGILILIACLSLSIYFSKQSTLNIGRNALLNDIGLLRAFVVNCVDSSRSLQLIDSGYVLLHNREDYMNTLKTNLESFESTLTSVLNEIEESDLENFFLNVKLITFEKEADKFNKYEKNLYGALRKFIDHSYGLTIENNIELDNQHFYYVYRNGLSETFTALNSTVFSAVHEADKFNQSSIKSLLIVNTVLISPCLIYILIVGLIIKYIESINILVWKKLLTIQKLELNEMFFQLKMRLERNHGEEDFTVLPSQSSNNTLYFPIWKKPILKLLLLLLIFSGVYLFYIFNIKVGYGETLSIGARYMPIGGLRRALAKQTFFWAREEALLDTSIGYFSIVPEHSYIVSPAASKLDTIENYKYINQILTYDTDYLPTKGYKNILKGNACDAIFLENCSFLSKGLTSGLVDFLLLMQYSSLTWEEIITLEQRSSSLQDAFKQAITLYSDIETDKLNEFSTHTILLFSLLIVFLVLYYVLLVRKDPLALYKNIYSRLYIIKTISKHIP